MLIFAVRRYSLLQSKSTFGPEFYNRTEYLQTMLYREQRNLGNTTDMIWFVQDTTRENTNSARMKAAADWWLLTQVDAMVVGHSSAFADKAILMAMHVPVIVRCSSSYASDLNITLTELNKMVPGWSCRPVEVRDLERGPTAM